MALWSRCLHTSLVFKLGLIPVITTEIKTDLSVWKPLSEDGSKETPEVLCQGVNSSYSEQSPGTDVLEDIWIYVNCLANRVS